MTSDHDLDAFLKRLHLANTRRAWRDLARRAEQEEWSYRDFLALLIAEEIAQRQQTRLGRLVRRARFPFLKTIDDFDFTHQTVVRLSLLGSTLAPDFVTEGRCLILAGKSGRGKTHLAVAVAYRAIQNGFDARFVTAAELIDDLSAAFRTGRLADALASYIHPGVLVVDEVGYLTYGTDAANMLFHVVNDRHRKKRAMIFTTNKPIMAWGRVLHDEDLAHAIVDRILERGRLLTLDGPSMRTKHLGLDDPTAFEASHQPARTPDREVIRISGIELPEFPEPTRPAVTRHTALLSFSVLVFSVSVMSVASAQSLTVRPVQYTPQGPTTLQNPQNAVDSSTTTSAYTLQFAYCNTVCTTPVIRQTEWYDFGAAPYGYMPRELRVRWGANGSTAIYAPDTGVAEVKIEYSLDSGQTWSVLESRTAPPNFVLSSHEVTLTLPPTQPLSFLRVRATVDLRLTYCSTCSRTSGMSAQINVYDITLSLQRSFTDWGHLSIDLASSDVRNGVTRVAVADGDTVADTVGGLPCRRNSNSSEDIYMYFSVSDEFAFQGSKPNLFISFHYFDTPGITFKIQYDSTLSAYQDGPSFATQGTNQWKAYTLGVKNAYFGNRQNGSADFRIAANVGVTFYVDLVYVRDPSPRLPGLHVAPTQGINVRPTPFRDACLNPDQWATGRSGTDFFGNADHIVNMVADADLASCFANLNTYRIRFLAEAGALKPWCTTGQACFDAGRIFWDRFRSMGARLEALSMDEPLNEARGLALADTYAVNETATWMKLVRDNYPNSQILSIEPYPQITAADLKWWVEALNDRCAAIGTPIMDMFVVDHDWNAAGWSFADIVDMQDRSRGLGPRFGVIFWAANKSGSTVDADWYSGLMQQGSMYKTNGIVPDLYSINDFINIPVVTLPETVSFTFTNSVKDFLRDYVQR